MSEKQSKLRRRAEPTYELTADEALSESVVAAVAAVSDTDSTALDPLAESIDPDALNALFDDRHDGTARDAGTVRFSFFGYEIVVGGDGCISVLETTK